MRLDEMVFVVQGPKIVKEDIAKAEALLGFKFPLDYVEFLLKFNGASLSYVCAESGTLEYDIGFA